MCPIRHAFGDSVSIDVWLQTDHVVSERESSKIADRWRPDAVLDTVSVEQKTTVLLAYLSPNEF